MNETYEKFIFNRPNQEETESVDHQVIMTGWVLDFGAVDRVRFQAGPTWQSS